MDTISRIATEIGSQLLQVGTAFLRIAITFGVAWLVAKFAGQWIEPRLSRRKYGRDGAILIARLTSILAYVVAFISMMNQFGVEWTGLLTLLSAFTVAIGLSLQDVMKNFFSGVLMLLERPFSVGDRVKVRDYDGEIQGIDIRTTLIRNSDGALVYVPNSIMFGEILMNRSHFHTRRLSITVSTSDTKIEDVEKIVRETLGSVSDVRKPVPEPQILTTSPDVISVRYSILIQANATAEHDVMMALWEAMPDATIEVNA